MGQEHKFKDVSPEATAESDAGLTAFERGDLVAAERHLRRADQLGGHWGAFRLGFLLEETGRPAEAEEAYRRAVDRGSRSAAVNLGHMLERRNDRAGAIEAYTAALRLGDVRSMRRLAALGQSVINTPDGVTVHQGTIWGLNVVMARDTYAAEKLTVEAYEQTLREAIERSRDRDAVTLAMANLGQLVESRGDFEQAEGLFRRVVAEADPDEPFHAASTLALANLVWQRGDGAEAGVWWRRAMLSGDSEAAPKAAFNLGAALIMQGRLEEAVEALRLAIDSGHPDEAPGASVRLGVARALQGDLGAARAAYDFAAASGHPEFAPQAFALLAELDGQQPSTPSPSPTRQMLAEGWNGLRWGDSLAEFKARFPQATEAAERSWATGVAQESFCGIPMTTRYFFNRHGRLCGMAFIPDMPDRERMPPFVVNELGWPPDGNNLLWVFDDVEVKAATVVVTVQHRRLADQNTRPEAL